MPDTQKHFPPTAGLPAPMPRSEVSDSPDLRLVSESAAWPPDSPRAKRAREAGRLQIRSDRQGTDHVITVSGELDLATAGALADELEAVLASDAQLIDLDLSGLTFIALCGVRVVDPAAARATAEGRERLELRTLPPQVQRVLELTGTISGRCRTA